MSEQSPGTVVRVSSGTRKVIVRVFGAMIALLVVADGLSLAGAIHNPNSPAKLIVSGALLVVLFGLVIVCVVRGRVALYADRIAVTRNLSPTRTLARADIVARRFHGYEGMWSSAYHVLITRSGDEVKLPAYLEHDKPFAAWLSDIPLASRQRRPRRRP